MNKKQRSDSLLWLVNKLMQKHDVVIQEVQKDIKRHDKDIEKLKAYHGELNDNEYHMQ